MPYAACMGIEPVGYVTAQFEAKSRAFVTRTTFDTRKQMSDRKIDYFCDSEDKAQLDYDPRYVFIYYKNKIEWAIGNLTS